MKILFLFILCTGAIQATALEQESAIRKLEALILAGSSTEEGQFEYFHVLKKVNKSDAQLVLDDESIWQIRGWDSSTIYEWEPGNKLKITHYSDYSSNNIKIENVNTQQYVWGEIKKNSPIYLRNSIVSISNSTLLLSNGEVFQGPSTQWNMDDAVFIFHNNDEGYDLWNIDNNEIVRDWILIGYEEPEDTLNIEAQLNRRVLGQEDAIQIVLAAVINYWAGLHNPKAPIGVFLFLGPTGVGKTELAKRLTEKLFKSESHLIRFDMSHFSESHSVSRLIGSPPGYVGYEKKGQMTEALKSKPESVVLLDEIEKAHPQVQKAFLPIFDEGYITDAHDEKVLCNRVIFIMTSNLLSRDIADLFIKGYSSEEIIDVIEPYLIDALSPEFYNRAVPVLFRPLSWEVMEALVDKMLAEVISRLKEIKNIELIIDDSARQHLIVEGFHPALGARPLKRLIQNKMVTALSTAIIREKIPDGSTITLSYSNGWIVHYAL